MKDILSEIVEKRKSQIKSKGFTFGHKIPDERKRSIHPFMKDKGLILEIKRASPSKGNISPDLDSYEFGKNYSIAGAKAVSCLTEENYFKGTLEDLQKVAQAIDDFEKETNTTGPALLRKDFLLFPEEIEISFRSGADAVLLIARILSKETFLKMAKEVERLGISALVEIRSNEDLEKLAFVMKEVNKENFVCGVNSRDLANFEIDLLKPVLMKEKINVIMGENAKIIFESGVTNFQTASSISNLGFHGILIGEAVAKNQKTAVNFVKAFACEDKNLNASFWKEYAKTLQQSSQKEKRYPFIKVCGLTNFEDAEKAESFGADFLGFIFSNNYPRSVCLEKRLEKISEKLNLLKSKKVAVITELNSPEAKRAIELVSEGKFDLIQFHKIQYEAVPDHFLKLPHYFAVSSYEERKLLIEKGEFRVLLDSKEFAANIAEEELSFTDNLWIAGGINPDNVSNLSACELVDVSSGVEENIIGKKSEVKMKDFFNSLNRQEKTTYSKDGFFDSYGGKYIAEVLRRPLDELETAFNKAMKDQDFLHELEIIRRDYIGRETPLYYAPKATELLGGAQIYIKLEGLANTGAHKINNAIGQCLLAKRMGKKRIIAETGAGQHGLATAAACAKLGLDCTIYMGEVDVRRQQPNVAAMELYGAKVHPVTSGSRTLKDAVNEAMRDWAANPDSTHYVLGSALGPAPFPDMVREFQSVIGREVKKQVEERGIKVGAMVACVGGGSNSIGFFEPFINEKSPRLIGAEAGGIGPGIGENASRMTGNAARDGILQGYKSRFLLDEDGQVLPTRSISAGLDYCGIGPQLAALGKSGRVEFTSILDKEALQALEFFAKNEGILFALESAHAGAAAMKIAKEIPSDEAIIINMSGRGDKDVFITSPVFRPQEWLSFLHSEIDRLEGGKDIHQL